MHRSARVIPYVFVGVALTLLVGLWGLVVLRAATPDTPRDRAMRLVHDGHKRVPHPIAGAVVERGVNPVVEPLPFAPLGTCDSKSECQQAGDQACTDSGYANGGQGQSAEITVRADGSKVCTVNCAGTSSSGGSGGVAVIECLPPAPHG